MNGGRKERRKGCRERNNRCEVNGVKEEKGVRVEDKDNE